MDQTRAVKRHPRRFPVSLGGKLPAVALDVSPEGFRVELPQVFLPGSIVEGFVLHQDRPLSFRGEVTWARAGDPRASVLSEMGIRFDSIDPELRKLVGGRTRMKKSA